LHYNTPCELTLNKTVESTCEQSMRHPYVCLTKQNTV